MCENIYMHLCASMYVCMIRSVGLWAGLAGWLGGYAKIR